MADPIILNVLIVDDNEINLMVFKKLIEKQNINALTATSGKEAIEIAAKSNLALILLDVQLPVMDGFTIAGAIKNLENCSHVPIIFVTAISQEEEHVQKGYAAGAVDYLFKPVAPHVLIGKVNVFIELHKQKMQLEHEIQERKKTEVALRRAEEKYRNIFVQAVEGIYRTREDGRFVEVNPAMAELLGYDSPQEVIEQIVDISNQLYHNPRDREKLLELIKANGSVTNFECQFKRKGGEIIWASLSARIYKESKKDIFVEGIMQDITERKMCELDLQHKATYDVLTGIPNRFLFFDRLNHAVAQAERYGWSGAVLFIDLDGFKPVNDNHGHSTGDRLLRAVAQRIAQRVRSSDTFARLGGDEFAVILTRISDMGDARMVADTILESIIDPYNFDDLELVIGASIGISVYPKDGTMSDELVNKADAAMYQAKKQGGGRVEFFNQGIKIPS